MSEIFGEQTLSTFARCIDEWLANIAGNNSSIIAVQRDEGPDRRWYVRMRGEEKEFTTIWLWLGQRTMKYETYVMPAPAENAEVLYEHVLRRNDKLVGAHFLSASKTRYFCEVRCLLPCCRKKNSTVPSARCMPPLSWYFPRSSVLDSQVISPTKTEPLASLL
jgi:hypothetical protein